MASEHSLSITIRRDTAPRILHAEGHGTGRHSTLFMPLPTSQCRPLIGSKTARSHAAPQGVFTRYPLL
jgi:hypothetical protein